VTIRAIMSLVMSLVDMPAFAGVDELGQVGDQLGSNGSRDRYCAHAGLRLRRPNSSARDVRASVGSGNRRFTRGLTT
jgi:hypothetical protein